MDAGKRHIAAIIGIDLYVIIIGAVRSPKTDHGFRLKPFFIDDTYQNFLCVPVKRPCRFPNFFIIENIRIPASKLPGLKERRPIEAINKLAEIIGTEIFHAKKVGSRRLITRPVNFEPVCTCIFNRLACLLVLPSSVTLCNLFVIFPHFLEIWCALGIGHDLCCDTNSPRGIGHIDRLPVMVIRVNLNGGVNLTRRRTADKKR